MIRLVDKPSSLGKSCLHGRSCDIVGKSAMPKADHISAPKKQAPRSLFFQGAFGQSLDTWLVLCLSSWVKDSNSTHDSKKKNHDLKNNFMQKACLSSVT
jgi:hypothetical protein